MEGRHIEIRGAAIENLVREAKRSRSVVLTRNGAPRALVVAGTDLAGWTETLEILGDAALMKQLRKAERELSRGLGRTIDEAFPRRRQRR